MHLGFWDSHESLMNKRSSPVMRAIAHCVAIAGTLRRDKNRWGASDRVSGLRQTGQHGSNGVCGAGRGAGSTPPGAKPCAAGIGASQRASETGRDKRFAASARRIGVSQTNQSAPRQNPAGCYRLKIAAGFTAA
jgi:hypothetical protein